MREKLLKIMTQVYTHERSETDGVTDAIALFAASLPLEGLTLEEHNQVVKQLVRSLQWHRTWGYTISAREEAKEALTLNGKQVKVKE